MAKRRTSSASKTPKHVGSATIIGLTIADSVSDVISKNAPLKTAPNVIFYSDNSKVTVDYSEAPQEDIDILLNFFEGMSSGDAFTVESETAKWIKERGEKIEAALDGSFTLLKFTGKTIEANVTTVTNKSAATDSYESKYFEQIPNLSTSITTTKTRNLSELRNLTGPNSEFSFKSILPILPGDQLELKTPLNKGKWTVVEYVIEKGIEKIVVNNFDKKLTTENLVGNPTPINFYRKGYEEKLLSSPLKKKIKEIRNSYGTGPRKVLSGTCCLYSKERRTDPETGHIFQSGDLYQCLCAKDWESVFIAEHLNMRYIFNAENRNFCEKNNDSYKLNISCHRSSYDL